MSQETKETPKTIRKTRRIRGRRARRTRGITRNPGLQNAIRKEIDIERARVDFTDAGAAFIECVTNPLGSESPTPIVAKIPDGVSQSTSIVVESGSYAIANGTATSMIVQLVGLSNAATTVDQSLQILTGANAEDMTATMTAVTEVFASQSTQLSAIFTSTVKGRVVGAALRISPVADDDITGQFRGGLTSVLGRSAAATYTTNGNVLGGNVSPLVYSAQQGITVRRTNPQGYDDFKLPNLTMYTGQVYAYENNWGLMPIISAWGLSNTLWNVQWRIVYEVATNPLTSPLACAPPPFEPELNGIIHTCNNLPFVSAGNSFKSFIRNAKSALRAGTRALRGAWQWASENRDAISTVGRLVSTVL